MPDPIGEFRADLADLLDEAVEHDLDWLRTEAAIILRDGIPFGPALQRAAEGLRASTGAEPTLADTGRLWQRLGGQLAREGRDPDAALALQLALRLLPGDHDASMDAGILALQSADVAAARAHFEAAAQARPDSAAAWAALAAAAARGGDFPRARHAAARALAIEPLRADAELALARTEASQGDGAQAIDRLRRLLARTDLDDADRVPCWDLLGDLLDAAQQPDAAFDAWTARNEALMRQGMRRPAAPGVESRRAQAQRIARHAQGWTAPQAPAPDADGEGSARVRLHVFLLGFPRSGTTLLEKALAGHPHCATLQETDPLGPIADALVAPGALERLARLPAAEADRARAAYWAAVGALAPAGDGRPVLVDKLPLNSVMLPVIARLFPAARIVFAVRDPRDVVLGCYRRRFRLNGAMVEFLSLQGTAEYYAAAMQIGAAARRHLPLATHVVRHEDVVADFDTQLHGVLRFLGLGWDAQVRDVAARAAGRAVTPSDLQLRGGLRADGVGTWRRHAARLVGVQPLLAPWVEAFGYPPD